MISALFLSCSPSSQKEADDEVSSESEQGAGDGGSTASTLEGNEEAGGDDSSEDFVGAGFSDYEESCADPCPEGSECRETQSGETCLSPCPGQPCPPGEGWTSYCDPQGGVTCLQEAEL